MEKNTEQKTWFDYKNLNKDIFKIILNLLDIKDLVSTQRVNKLLKELVSEEIFEKTKNQLIEKELIKHINSYSNLNEKIELKLSNINFKLPKMHPIFIAVKFCSIECFRLIASKKIKVDFLDSSYKTVLDYIMERLEHDMLDILFEYYPLESQFLLLMAANGEGNKALMLLKGNKSENAERCARKSYTFLVKNCGLNMTYSYFEHCFINSNGKNIFNLLMLKLIKQQNLSAIEKLSGNPRPYHTFTYLNLAQGDLKKRTYIHWAVACGGQELIEYFLYPFETISNTEILQSENEIINLKEAVKNEIKKILVHQDIDGNTPLHLAATLGNVKVAELLIKYGGVEALNILNNAGKKPLTVAQDCDTHHPKRRTCSTNRKIIERLKKIPFEMQAKAYSNPKDVVPEESKYSVSENLIFNWSIPKLDKFETNNPVVINPNRFYKTLPNTRSSLLKNTFKENTDDWYSAELIDKLLKLQLQDEQVEICAALYPFLRSKENDASRLFQSIFCEVIKLKHPAVITINLIDAAALSEYGLASSLQGRHWIGLAILPSQETQTYTHKLMIVDSLGNGLSHDKEITTLDSLQICEQVDKNHMRYIFWKKVSQLVHLMQKAMITEDFLYKPQIIVTSRLQQTNGSDCGAFVVQNLVNIIRENGQLCNQTGEELRLLHNNLLNQNLPKNNNI